MSIKRPIQVLLSRRTKAIAGASLAAVALTLASCSTSAEDADKSSDTTTTTTTTATSSSASSEASSSSSSSDLALNNGYIKPKTADKSMTGIFGTIHNSTDKEVKLESVSSKDDKMSGMFQLHIVENGTMKQVQDGFTIPANGDFRLYPGGPHIMLMQNNTELAVGDSADIVLHFSDGSEVTATLPVLEQASGEEDYNSFDSSANKMGNMDMSNSSESASASESEHANH